MPPGWQPIELTMRDAPALTPAELDGALDHPVGAPGLGALAAGKRRAVIAIDDMTRPTRTAPLISRVVSRLVAAGMTLDSITGTHRGWRASGGDPGRCSRQGR